MLLRSVIALGAGLLLSAAFEPVALPLLLPVAVAGYWWSTRGLSVPRAGLVGALFGVAFYFTHIAWMRTSIGPDAWAALAGIEAAFYGLLGLAVPVLSRLRWSPLWLAAAWTTMETVRSQWPFSGMPWGRLAFAVADTPVAPALAYLSMAGLSFALALLGVLLADVVGREAARRRAVAALGAAGTVAVLVVPAALPFSPERDATLRVAVVQGDVPGPGNDILFDSPGVTRNHVDATVDLAEQVAAGRRPRPDLVVWPENSTATDPFVDGPIREGIERAVAAIDVPVMVGAIVDDGPDYILNQGIVWDPVSGPGERYTKHHPVPYGEYIPYRSLFEPQFGRLKEISRDQRNGTRSTPLRVAGTLVADAICFDVAYDDVLPRQVRAGARLLTVQTSNASFIFTHQIEQQFAITRLRAIEAGRWLAVASTNGRTGIVAPDGSVVASLAPRTTGVLDRTVGLSSSLTPAMALGAWPSRLFTVLSLAALVTGILTYRRRRECAPPASSDDPPEGRRSEADERPDSDDDEVPMTDPTSPERAADTDHLGRVLVVVPTYDEAANLAWIVGRLRHARPEVEVLVVDDASPDGTGRIADALAAEDPAVHVLHRTGKGGLGAAYLAGFAWALERDYDVVGEMDADGSHQPEQLHRLLDGLLDADLVIGSRWVPGGSVVNWPWQRELLSRGGNLYVRLLLGVGVRDATAGYRLFRRTTLEKLRLEEVRSTGYVFQTDLVARTLRAGLTVREVPIEFVERVRGESKMSGQVALESLRRITFWGLRERWHQLRTGRRSPRVQERRQARLARRRVGSDA